MRLVERLEMAYDQAIMYAHDLNEAIRERKRAEDALRKSEETYRTLVKSSLTGIYIVQDGKVVFANNRFARIYGYSHDEVIGMELLRLVHADDRDYVEAVATKRLRGEEAPSEYEARGLTKDGRTIWVASRDTQIEYRGRHAVLGNVVDITELREVTITLRVLLRERARDRTEFEEEIASNVKELVLPFVEALKNTRLNDRQAAYAAIIESNLKEIVSPCKLSSEHLALTSKEIQVAELIKDGKSTKEIAGLLYMSTAAVDFHRKNLRRKLGLTKKRTNLRAYLLFLTQYED